MKAAREALSSGRGASDMLPYRIILFAIAFPGLLPTDSWAQGHEDWSYNLGIYEVNVRQYTEEGTFAEFEDHLDRLQAMGVGILWFMPVHPIGLQNRLSSLGSYYSVRDYLDINPEFGTLDDFRRLVQAVHDREMYVLMDWVANHTAWDHPFTAEHPEWYSTDANGNFMPPPGTNWSDVIELDYSQQGLRDYMIDAMKFWVEEVGVDGFRFDAVDFVPHDFWAEAVEELKRTKPDIFLLAEGDARVWHDLGFEMTHGWGLYGFGGGVLKRIADGLANAANLNGYISGEKITYPSAYRMYFTSNHDENSWYGTSTELFGEAAEVFAVLTATFHGMPLIYSGQEAGLNKRLLFFDKDQITWSDHTNTQLYTTLLHLKRENRALWNGAHGGLLQRVLSNNNTDVFAFVRENEADRVFVALNLSDSQQTVTFSGTSFTGEFRNVFTDESVSLEEDATLTLSPWGYVVYANTEATTDVGGDVLPDGFLLRQNYPNPFNSVTAISYDLAAPSDVKLAIYDMLGREVQVLASGMMRAGSHEVTFSAAHLPSGIYFYRLQAETQGETMRLILLR